jgi:hypothetical protein
MEDKISTIRKFPRYCSPITPRAIVPTMIEANEATETPRRLPRRSNNTETTKWDLSDDSDHDDFQEFCVLVKGTEGPTLSWLALL